MDRGNFLGDNTPVQAIGLDYSLQIQTGLERLCMAAKNYEKPFDVLDPPTVCAPSSLSPDSSARIAADRASRRRELDSVNWNAFDAPIR